MKIYEITFANEEVRTMTVVSDECDPVAEVAKWANEELSVENIVSVVEVA